MSLQVKSTVNSPAMKPAETHRHYQQVASAIAFFVEQRVAQPGLAELSEHLGLSEFHLQRLFSEWVGVSPKQFLKFLTKQEAKRRLQQQSVLDAALDLGLSGSGRLHDLMVTCEAVTPGQFKQQGAGLEIHYGVVASPFGEALLAQTQKGVCKLGFFDGADGWERLLLELQAEWPKATLRRDDGAVAPTAAKVFGSATRASNKMEPGRLHVLMKGSPFQLKVWEALLAIPQGEIRTYQQVADAIGSPDAVRAVASAIGRNHVGYLIPCHRVIRSTGEFSQYAWGATRKQAMIGWEACHR